MKFLQKGFMLLSSCMFFFSFAALTFADTIEEEECMKILATTVKSKYGEDLTTVKLPANVRPTSTDTVDLSNYEQFREFRLGNKMFGARRNNIGTILLNNNYIKSQIVTFGESDTDFEYPLQHRGESEKKEGDLYTSFYNNLVYTHHLNDGTFVSCGYFNLEPALDGQYQGLSADNYMTNGIREGNSGFKILNPNKIVSQEGKDYNYLIGKVRVPGIGYDEKPLFYMNVITVAWDNNSHKFNEYQTFPYQVQAMSDMSDTAAANYSTETLQMNFVKLAIENTCLKFLHKSDKSDLPAGCDDEFRSESPTKTAGLSGNKSLLSYIIPTTYAALDADEIDIETEENTDGPLISGSIPYSLMKKLSEIPDQNFQAYVRTAVVPNIEQVFKYEKDNEIYSESDFQEKFLACNITHEERVDVVQEFLTNLDIENFDTENITWKNPRFGDCIVPYPDKTHLTTVIEDSFESNQIEAKKRNGTLEIMEPESPKYSPEIMEQMEKEAKLEKAYTQEIFKYSSELEAGKITQEEYDSLVNELMLRKDTMVEALSSDQDIDSEQYKMDTKGGIFMSWTMLIGTFLIFFGFLILVFVLRSPKKN